MGGFWERAFKGGGARVGGRHNGTVVRAATTTTCNSGRLNHAAAAMHSSVVGQLQAGRGEGAVDGLAQPHAPGLHRQWVCGR